MKRREVVTYRLARYVQWCNGKSSVRLRKSHVSIVYNGRWKGIPVGLADTTDVARGDESKKVKSYRSDDLYVLFSSLSSEVCFTLKVKKKK
uniref:Uncharacterized protein n=1 Tax=Vespula pensylvanica TaxID=30213 RepID=A0A834NPZ9_VESPE|nr:hypothetical protein H0235_011974 [Vespula pensylvanica]